MLTLHPAYCCVAVVELLYGSCWFKNAKTGLDTVRSSASWEFGGVRGTLTTLNLISIGHPQD